VLFATGFSTFLRGLSPRPVGTASAFNRVRYYDPKAGRWIVLDPIGFRGQDLNLYRYVRNRPSQYVDPQGAIPLPIDTETEFHADHPPGQVPFHPPDEDYCWLKHDECVHRIEEIVDLCRDRPEWFRKPCDQIYIEELDKCFVSTNRCIEELKEL
jgi:RHS repeat-associated protein